MKKLFIAVSLLLSVSIGTVSIYAQKDPVKETKASAISKDDLSEMKKSLADIQKSQKAILDRLSDLEKKITAPAAQGKPAIDPNKVYNLPVAHSPIKGNKSAPVTIVEFSDFQCPYCAQLQATLTEVLNAYPKDVRLVFKHYPLPFHQNAMIAAKATEAAKEQGKFWEMHDLVFQNFNKLSEQALKDFAQQLGLDVEKFSADLAGNKYDQLIQQDMALARSSDVSGTPTLFINGKRVQQRSFNDFKQTIDGILKK
ncbi:MAG: thioredoxin domain-containing protein [Nitrospirae bacterium]|nr:thioredoxin domain-containing protein [Nitrospirota bacterium]